MMHSPGQPGRSHRSPMGGGPTAAMMKGDKARHCTGTMRKLIQYLGKYQVAVLVVILFAIASTIFTIFGPKILGNADVPVVHRALPQLSSSRFSRLTAWW